MGLFDSVSEFAGGHAADSVVALGLDAGPLKRDLGQVAPEMEKAAAGWGKAFKLASIGLGVFAAGFLGFVADGVKKADELDAAIARMGAQTGKSAAEMAKMRAGLLDISTRVPHGIDELAKSIEQVARAGYSVDDSLRIQEAAAKAATVTHADLASVTSTVVTAMKAWNIAGKDVNKVTDTLLTTVGRSRIDWDSLSRIIATAAPIAKDAGVSFQDLNAAIIAVGRSGLPARRAASGVITLIRSLSSPAAQKQMAALGITVNATTIKHDGLLKTLQKLELASRKHITVVVHTKAAHVDLTKATETLRVAEMRLSELQRKRGVAGSTMLAAENRVADARRRLAALQAKATAGGIDYAKSVEATKKANVGSLEVMKAMVGGASGLITADILLANGAKDFKEGQDALNKSVGQTAAEFRAVMEADIGAQIALIRNKVTTLAIDLGTMLLPYVAKFVHWLADELPKALRGIGDLWNQYLKGPVTAMVSSFLGFAAALGRVLFDWGSGSAGANGIRGFFEALAGIMGSLATDLGVVFGVLTNFLNIPGIGVLGKLIEGLIAFRLLVTGIPALVRTLLGSTGGVFKSLTGIGGGGGAAGAGAAAATGGPLAEASDAQIRAAEAQTTAAEASTKAAEAITENAAKAYEQTAKGAEVTTKAAEALIEAATAQKEGVLAQKEGGLAEAVGGESGVNAAEMIRNQTYVESTIAANESTIKANASTEKTNITTTDADEASLKASDSAMQAHLASKDAAAATLPAARAQSEAGAAASTAAGIQEQAAATLKEAAGSQIEAAGSQKAAAGALTEAAAALSRGGLPAGLGRAAPVTSTATPAGALTEAAAKQATAATGLTEAAVGLKEAAASEKVGSDALIVGGREQIAAALTQKEAALAQKMGALGGGLLGSGLGPEFGLAGMSKAAGGITGLLGKGLGVIGGLVGKAIVPLLITQIATDILKAPAGDLVASQFGLKNVGAKMKEDFLGGAVDWFKTVVMAGGSEAWVGKAEDTTIGSATFKTINLAKLGIDEATIDQLQAPAGTILHAQGEFKAIPALTADLAKKASETVAEWFNRVRDQLPTDVASKIANLLADSRTRGDPKGNMAKIAQATALLTQQTARQLGDLSQATFDDYISALEPALKAQGFTGGQIRNLNLPQLANIGNIMAHDTTGQYKAVVDFLMHTYLGEFSKNTAVQVVNLSASQLAQAQTIAKILGLKTGTALTSLRDELLDPKKGIFSQLGRGFVLRKGANPALIKALSAQFGADWQQVTTGILKNLRPPPRTSTGAGTYGTFADSQKLLEADATTARHAVEDFFKTVPQNVRDALDQFIASEPTRLPAATLTGLKKRFGDDWLVAFKDGTTQIGTKSKADKALGAQFAAAFGPHWREALQTFGTLLFARGGGADAVALKRALAGAISKQIAGLLPTDLAPTPTRLQQRTGEAPTAPSSSQTAAQKAAIQKWFDSAVGQAAVAASQSPDVATAKKGMEDLGKGLVKWIPDQSTRDRFIGIIAGLGTAAKVTIPNAVEAVTAALGPLGNQLGTLAGAFGNLAGVLNNLLANPLVAALTGGGGGGGGSTPRRGVLKSAAGLNMATSGETHITAGHSGETHIIAGEAATEQVVVVSGPKRLSLSQLFGVTTSAPAPSPPEAPATPTERAPAAPPPAPVSMRVTVERPPSPAPLAPLTPPPGPGLRALPGPAPAVPLSPPAPPPSPLGEALRGLGRLLAPPPPNRRPESPPGLAPLPPGILRALTHTTLPAAVMAALANNPARAATPTPAPLPDSLLRALANPARAATAGLAHIASPTAPRVRREPEQGHRGATQQLFVDHMHIQSRPDEESILETLEFMAPGGIG